MLTAIVAEKLNMAFYETSAKDKTMVDDAFFALTRDIKKRLGESSGGPSTTRTTGPITVPSLRDVPRYFSPRVCIR